MKPLLGVILFFFAPQLLDKSCCFPDHSECNLLFLEKYPSQGRTQKINGPLRGLVGGKQGKDLKSYEKNTLFLRISQTDRNTLKGLFALTKL